MAPSRLTGFAWFSSFKSFSFSLWASIIAEFAAVNSIDTHSSLMEVRVPLVSCLEELSNQGFLSSKFSFVISLVDIVDLYV